MKRILNTGRDRDGSCPFSCPSSPNPPISRKMIPGPPRGTGVSGLPEVVALLDLVGGPGAAYWLHVAYKVASLPSAPGSQYEWNSEAAAAES